jgi:acyl carrier protein
MLVAAADCADAAAMRRVVSQAEERFGAIDGLFHAAAVTDLSAVHRPLEEMRDEESELQFHAKIYGLQVLSEVFSNHNLDFALVFSSNASILGGLGLTAYTAANAFMNAFASRRASESHRVMWRSVTWDGWPRLTPSEAGRLGIDAYRMERDESLQALGRVLSVSDVPWLAVSAGNLRARRDFWVRRLTAASAKPSASAPAERRELTRPYEAPRNGTESAVSDMLADLLGVRRVGIHDNFFELGGHSLLATRLLGRVRRQFSANVTLRRFFTEPTVAGLATAIVEVRAAQADPGVLERLLDGLENNG